MSRQARCAIATECATGLSTNDANAATPLLSDTAAALLASMACDFWAYELYASDVVVSRKVVFPD